MSEHNYPDFLAENLHIIKFLKEKWFEDYIKYVNRTDRWNIELNIYEKFNNFEIINDFEFAKTMISHIIHLNTDRTDNDEIVNLINKLLDNNNINFIKIEFCWHNFSLSDGEKKFYIRIWTKSEWYFSDSKCKNNIYFYVWFDVNKYTNKIKTWLLHHIIWESNASIGDTTFSWLKALDFEIFED